MGGHWNNGVHIFPLIKCYNLSRMQKTRIFADELSFSMQAIVVVPDIYRGRSFMEPSIASSISSHQPASAPTPPSPDMPSTTSSPADVQPSGMTVRTPSHATSYVSSPEFQQWLRQQPPDRIFDDIVSALHYCRTEYSCRSVSLAGVGFGAGRALEATCDLWDLACLAQVGMQRITSLDWAGHTLHTCLIMTYVRASE